VPLYFATANHVPLRITSMSVTISLSASVTMACLFTPKVIFLSKIMKFSDQNELLSALHYSGASGTQHSSEHDDGKSMQGIEQAANHGIHVNDVNCDGYGDDMQSKGENSASHVDCRCENVAIFW
jgi:hypothetical protein